MNFGIKKRSIAGAVGAAAMLLAGAAQAALQDRDLDGNGVTDAFYDTDLDITWLRDANVNGGGVFAAATSWIAGFSLGGYTGWRLPSTAYACFGYCSDSEMGHLWYVELGNPAGGGLIINTGGFQNLQGDYYWSSTPYDAGNTWVFSMGYGEQTAGWNDGNQFYAMAVRDGDVMAVPEPETYALMLVGLAGLALASRQRKR